MSNKKQTLDVALLKVESTTIGELEATLPHGIMIDGVLCQNVVFPKLKGKHHRQLENISQGKSITGVKLRADNKTTFFTEFCNFLAEFVTNIENYTLKEATELLGHTDASQVFRGMLLGDFIALMLAIKIKGKKDGAAVAITDTCPRCGTLNEDGDEHGYHYLETVQVNIIPELTAAPVGTKLIVNLEDGLELENKVLKQIEVVPFTVKMAEKFWGKTGDQLESEQIISFIQSIPGYSLYEKSLSSGMNRDIFDELSSDDISLLKTAMNKLYTLGAQLVIENECHNCGNIWSSMIPVGNLLEFFFPSFKVRSTI